MWNPSPLSSLPLKIAFIISFFLSHCFFFVLLSPNPCYHSISIPKVNSKKQRPLPPIETYSHSLARLSRLHPSTPQVAVELQSCFNFIVPFNPTTNTPPDYRFNLINQLSQSLTESRIQFPRHTLNSKARRDVESYQNELI